MQLRIRIVNVEDRIGAVVPRDDDVLRISGHADDADASGNVNAILLFDVDRLRIGSLRDIDRAVIVSRNRREGINRRLQCRHGARNRHPRFLVIAVLGHVASVDVLAGIDDLDLRRCGGPNTVGPTRERQRHLDVFVDLGRVDRHQRNRHGHLAVGDDRLARELLERPFAAGNHIADNQVARLRRRSVGAGNDERARRKHRLLRILARRNRDLSVVKILASVLDYRSPGRTRANRGKGVHRIGFQRRGVGKGLRRPFRDVDPLRDHISRLSTGEHLRVLGSNRPLAGQDPYRELRPRARPEKRRDFKLRRRGIKGSRFSAVNQTARHRRILERHPIGRNHAVHKTHLVILSVERPLGSVRIRADRQRILLVRRRHRPRTGEDTVRIDINRRRIIDESDMHPILQQTRNRHRRSGRRRAARRQLHGRTLGTFNLESVSVIVLLLARKEPRVSRLRVRHPEPARNRELASIRHMIRRNRKEGPLLRRIRRVDTRQAEQSVGTDHIRKRIPAVAGVLRRHGVKAVASRIQRVSARLVHMPNALVAAPDARRRRRNINVIPVIRIEGRAGGNGRHLDPDERLALRIPRVDFVRIDRDHPAVIDTKRKVGAVGRKVGILEAVDGFRQPHKHRKIRRRLLTDRRGIDRNRKLHLEIRRSDRAKIKRHHRRKRGE